MSGSKAVNSIRCSQERSEKSDASHFSVVERLSVGAFVEVLASGKPQALVEWKDELQVFDFLVIRDHQLQRAETFVVALDRVVNPLAGDESTAESEVPQVRQVGDLVNNLRRELVAFDPADVQRLHRRVFRYERFPLSDVVEDADGEMFERWENRVGGESLVEIQHREVIQLTQPHRQNVERVVGNVTVGVGDRDPLDVRVVRGDSFESVQVRLCDGSVELQNAQAAVGLQVVVEGAFLRQFADVDLQLVDGLEVGDDEFIDLRRKRTFDLQLFQRRFMEFQERSEIDVEHFHVVDVREERRQLRQLESELPRLVVVEQNARAM